MLLLITASESFQVYGQNTMCVVLRQRLRSHPDTALVCLQQRFHVGRHGRLPPRPAAAVGVIIGGHRRCVEGMGTARNGPSPSASEESSLALGLGKARSAPRWRSGSDDTRTAGQSADRLSLSFD